MPASTRRSVVLPEPLWPTRPMRSPSLISRLRPSMARTVTISRALAMTRPPVACDKIWFLNERALAPKIANSTVRFSMEICAIRLRPSMRCGHRPAIEPGGEAEPGRRHADAEAPAHWRHHLAKQWRPNDLDEVIERVEQHKSRPARQGFGRPEYRGQEKYDLDHVGYHLWDIAIAGGEHPDRQRYPRGVDQEQDEAGDEQQGVPSGRQLEPDDHEEVDG